MTITIENLRKLTNELAAATKAVSKAEAALVTKEAIRDAKAAELTRAVNAFKTGEAVEAEVELDEEPDAMPAF